MFTPTYSTAQCQGLRRFYGDYLRRHGMCRLFTVILLFVVGLTFFIPVVVPQIIRLRFRYGMSWYDLGYYGFGPSHNYVSFNGESPFLEISPAEANCDPRYTFLAPRGDSVDNPGPMILDADGELVWSQHNWGTTQDFKVQKFKGEDYLTYWQGAEEDGHGVQGGWYMLDSTYTVRHIVSPYGALQGDLHDFQITSNDTALLVIYDPIPADLTTVGGPKSGWLYDGVIQEIDISTGELLFEWRSSSYYPPESSYMPVGDRGHERGHGYDYFHMNSVDKDDFGRYLVSARHTHTITCIDGTTGHVLWTLGGKSNDFIDGSDGEATGFKWQHDARWYGPNKLTLFNNAAGDIDQKDTSHGLLVELDFSAQWAKVVQKYDHPQGLMAVSQGNLQALDTGNMLVGWGHSAAFTEFSYDGDVVCNAHFGASAYFSFGRTQSYRVFKADWTGAPKTLPDIAVQDDSIFVSWNGATEVASWRLEAWDGESLSDMAFIGIGDFERRGFETEISLTSEVSAYFRVSAINAHGEVISTSRTISRPTALQKPHILTDFLPNVAWIAALTVVSLGCLLYGAHQAARRFKSRAGRSGIYQLLAPRDSEEVETTECESLPY